MSDKKEYGKRCQLCWKYKRSRMYPMPIHGQYRRICRQCWDMVSEGAGSE